MRKMNRQVDRQLGSVCRWFVVSDCLEVFAGRRRRVLCRAGGAGGGGMGAGAALLLNLVKPIYHFPKNTFHLCCSFCHSVVTRAR